VPRRGTHLSAASFLARPKHAAAVAFWSLTAFAVIHICWALGYRWGLTTFVAYPGQLEAEMISSPWFRALGLWGVALLSIAGAAVAGTVLRKRDWSTTNRRIVALLAAGAAAILFIRGGCGLVCSPLRLLGVLAIPDDTDHDWF
jgi:hypothetical protein